MSAPENKSFWNVGRRSAELDRIDDELDGEIDTFDISFELLDETRSAAGTQQRLLRDILKCDDDAARDRLLDVLEAGHYQIGESVGAYLKVLFKDVPEQQDRILSTMSLLRYIQQSQQPFFDAVSEGNPEPMWDMDTTERELTDFYQTHVADEYLDNLKKQVTRKNLHYIAKVLDLYEVDDGY